jgi:hypothetical protein
MKYRVKFLLLTIALAGFLFCLLSAMGITDDICLTKGCEVYKEYTVAGISFYWIGAAVFLMLGLMFFWTGNYIYLTIFTGLALIGNFAFLIIQFLMWPCTNCLIAAVLLGSFAWGLAGRGKPILRILCVVWLLLFSANILALAKDSISPWPVLGKNNADIQVFFSPTCPACRQVVENFLQNPDMLPQVAFYPLAKDDNDYRRVKLLVRNLRQGIPAEQAFSVHWQLLTRHDSSDRDWNMSFNLWRNQIYLARKGGIQVPLIISRIALGESSDKSAATTPDGCSIFSRDSEGCEDEQPPDPFETIFK